MQISFVVIVIVWAVVQVLLKIDDIALTKSLRELPLIRENAIELDEGRIKIETQIRTALSEAQGKSEISET